MRAAALICLIGCLAPAHVAAEWRRLDSPNFITIGDASERDLRNIAMQFEGFRETLGRVLSAKVTATAVPTVVVVFPHDRAFTPYKPVYNGKPVDVGGVFYSGRDANYITLVNDQREGRLRVLFHEYAHLMISNVVMNLPAWLSEGLAEYYSTYEHSRDGREAVIGRPVESHLQRLAEGRLLPLKELISVDRDSPLYNEGERRSVFYAQSWALTHMLLLGEPNRAKELKTFMGAAQSGVSAPEAWRQAFGDADVARALQQYIRSLTFKAYRFRFSEALATVDATARPMPQAEVSAFLAGLRVRQRRVGDAETLADAALVNDKNHPHANVAKAQADIAKGDRKAAVGRLMTLDASGDWFVRYAAGTTLTDGIEGERGDHDDGVAAARAHLTAVGRTREIPNALAELTKLDLLTTRGATTETLAAIERARALAPGRDDYVLLQARVLAELNQFALARSVLGPLMTPASPEQVRGTARSWMGAIVRREEQHRAIEAARDGAPAGSGRATEERRDTQVEPTAVKPVFRVLEKGEHRLEGALERISCPPNAGVVFHVDTAAGAERLRAAKFEAVEFITYRGDLSGSINCGPLKEPMRVYVTWRQGAGLADRIVIAIEFLPK